MKTIIVGAGAAGIIAARILAENGHEVLIFEATNRIGGRIHTFRPDNFPQNIEGAAEFIHGSLPLTLQLMDEANLPYMPATGDFYRVEGNQLTSGFAEGKNWSAFYKAMEEVTEDITVEELLSRFDGPQYAQLKKEVRDMAQGLDLADPARLSVMAVRDEWLSDEQQFRTKNGYGPLIDWLSEKAVKHGATLKTEIKVTAIQHSGNGVEVITETDRFRADHVVITVPLGCLQKRDITFDPPISAFETHFDNIGCGEVIKFVMAFETAFWEKQHPDLGFLFTDEGFTFWTQLSEHRPVLTGWIGNDYASTYAFFSDDELIRKALSKLEPVYGNRASELKASAVFRYTKNTPSRGAYSWPMPESRQAEAEIAKGIDGKIFFAGEAFYKWDETATVEAALQSGKQTAERLLRKL